MALQQLVVGGLALILWYMHVKNHRVDVVRETKSHSDSYDYIIVGSGSGGSPLASRLSEDPDVSVLVLEAGGQPVELSAVPLTSFLLQRGPLDWNFTTVPQKRACLGLKDRVNFWPRGYALGGSTSINFNLFVRANPVDYDDWEESGAEGWSWKDVLPYFLKLEDQTDPAHLREGLHSTGGPVTIETVKYVTPIARAFMEAGRYIGYDHILLNGRRHVGFALPQGTTRNHERCSVARAYLGPASFRPNLDVMTGAYVTKVHFDQSKRARSVEFYVNGARHVVRSNREVILSAGPINSPKILMHSGVGPADHLRSHGIPVVRDLPGVGQNLMEHPFSIGLSFKTKKGNALNYFHGVYGREEYLESRSGPFTILGGVEAMGFIRTSYARNDSLDTSDVQFHFVPTSPSTDVVSFRQMNINEKVIAKYYSPYLTKETFSIYPVLLNPKSRGSVTLASNDPFEAPLIDPNFLDHPDDRGALAEAMMLGYKMGLTKPMLKIGVEIFEKKLPNCEKYIKATLPYWGCVVDQLTMGVYHPAGTCKMGRRSNPTAVVDNHLRVIGVRGLRVVDSSIYPKPIAGNTNVPTIMIGEKAADLIKSDYYERSRSYYK